MAIPEDFLNPKEIATPVCALVRDDSTLSTKEKTMEAYKREFIQFLQRAGVLKFGDFTAKSGRKIPYFINAGMIKTGDEIAKLGEFYAKAYFD